MVIFTYICCKKYIQKKICQFFKKKHPWFGFGADYHSGLFDPKRSGSRGFHEGIFDQGFGGFSTLKKRATKRTLAEVKRRPEMTSRGIHGDAFTGRCVL